MSLIPYTLKTVLTEEQAEALPFLTSNPRCILADSTGTGKTLSVLAAALELVKQDPTRHILVVGPKTAYPTWKAEIAKHTTAKAAVLTTGEYLRESSTERHITFLTYPMLQDMKDEIQDIYRHHRGKVILVLEEAQYCMQHRKTRSTIITSADSDTVKIKKEHTLIRQVTGPMVRLCEYAWAVTATPLMNNILSLYGLFDLLLPGLLGNEYKFLNTYTVRVKRTGKNGHSYYEIIKYQKLDQLQQICAPYILKRVRNYDVRFFIHAVDMTPEEEERYFEAAQGLLGNTLRDFAGRLPDLQRVVDNAVIHDREPNLSPTLSSKETFLMERIIPQLQEHRGVIIFTELRDTFARVKRVLEAHILDLGNPTLLTLTAEDSVETREQVQKQFGADCILLMTNVGRESLNLQRGNIVWMYDVPWNMGSAVQLVGRVARMNSTFPWFEVHIPCVRDSIDQYKTAMLHHKADIFRAILNGEKAMPKSSDFITREMLVKMRKSLLWRKGQTTIRKRKAKITNQFQWEEL